MRRVSLVITGKVQGVFFRRETGRQAHALALAGFVRNESDGSVYVEAQGPAEKVGALIRWCRRGPENARVDEVRVTEETPQEAPDDLSDPSGNSLENRYTFKIVY